MSPTPKCLLLIIRQHSSRLWRWALVEPNQEGQETGRGFARSILEARNAAHRYSSLIWPGVPVIERQGN